MLNVIINHVAGTLSQQHCELLQALVGDIPNAGVIYDFNCGAGRATFAMAEALKQRGLNETHILAFDTHIVDPFVVYPYSTGTLSLFLNFQHKYGFSNWITPVVSSPQDNEALMGKRSANLVVVQAPGICPTLEAIEPSVQLAKRVTRKNGSIVVCAPFGCSPDQFAEFVFRQFSKDYLIQHNIAGFTSFQSTI